MPRKAMSLGQRKNKMVLRHGDVLRALVIFAFFLKVLVTAL